MAATTERAILSTGMMFGAACNSRHRSGPARWRCKQSAAGRAPPRRKSKSADRTANPQNLSSFVQTNTARPGCRGRIRKNPSMSRLEMPCGDGALAVA